MQSVLKQKSSTLPVLSRLGCFFFLLLPWLCITVNAIYYIPAFKPPWLFWWCVGIFLLYRGVDSLLSQISFHIISCTTFLMPKAEVCKFLSMRTGVAYGEYGLNVSSVAYPLFLDLNSCSLASIGQQCTKHHLSYLGEDFFWWPCRAFAVLTHPCIHAYPALLMHRMPL